MKIYGASDDLVEFEGIRFKGEVAGNFDTDEDKRGLIFCSDGTVLEVAYGKTRGGESLAVWEFLLVTHGSLFEQVDECFDEEATPYSDVVHFADDLEWAYVAHRWERVK